MKRIYNTTRLPRHWIVEDEAGDKWIVPAIENGWQQKRPYKGGCALDECTVERVALQRLTNIGAR